jgi:hypothetical protein
MKTLLHMNRREIKVTLGHVIGIILMILLFLITFFVLWVSFGKNDVAAPGSQVKATSDRRNTVTCDDLDITDEEVKQFPTLQKMTRGDSSLLPQNFPPLPLQTELCGSLSNLDAIFYITRLRDEDLLNYFRIELDKAGFTVEQVKPGSDKGDKVLEFKDSQGAGALYSYGNKKAFAVTFIRVSED